MAFIAPSATEADKKKQELLQQIIQKATPVVDIIARTMVDEALGRTHSSNSSSYDVALSKPTPESQPYKLSTPTLVDFVQKIVWPNTYIFDSGWTDAPNGDKEGGAMRGIGTNAGNSANTDGIFGTAILSRVKNTSYYAAASDDLKKSIDELGKVYTQFKTSFKDQNDNLETRKNIVYVLGTSDLVGSLFYTYFLCSQGAGQPIRLMANDPYMGYLFADFVWNSGPSSVISEDRDDFGAIGITFQPTKELVDKTTDKSTLVGYNIGSQVRLYNAGAKRLDVTNFALQNTTSKYVDIPFTTKIEDKKAFDEAITAAAKTDNIFKYAPFWLLARQRQIKLLTNSANKDKFENYFKPITERIGFVPFSMDTFQKQAINRLGIEGDGKEVSNMSMIAIIGELLCANTKGMFNLNEYEKKFLAVKYALYKSFKITIS